MQWGYSRQRRTIGSFSAIAGLVVHVFHFKFPVECASEKKHSTVGQYLTQMWEKVDAFLFPTSMYTCVIKSSCHIDQLYLPRLRLYASSAYSYISVWFSCVGKIISGVTTMRWCSEPIAIHDGLQHCYSGADLGYILIDRVESVYYPCTGYVKHQFAGSCVIMQFRLLSRYNITQTSISRIQRPASVFSMMMMMMRWLATICN